MGVSGHGNDATGSGVKKGVQEDIGNCYLNRTPHARTLYCSYTARAHLTSLQRSPRALIARHTATHYASHTCGGTLYGSPRAGPISGQCFAR